MAEKKMAKDKVRADVTRVLLDLGFSKTLDKATREEWSNKHVRVRVGLVQPKIGAPYEVHEIACFRVGEKGERLIKNEWELRAVMGSWLRAR